MSFFNWNKKPDPKKQGNDDMDDKDMSDATGTMPQPTAPTDNISFDSYVQTFLTNVNSAESKAAPVGEEVSQFSSAATQQAVAMMGEDIRTYMQGMEIIYTAASAKALEMIASDNPTGPVLLTAVTDSQTATGQFSVEVAACAQAFAKL
jgi:hypothetical protein